MHRDEYLAQAARDGRRMEALARGDLDVPVPTCPDWTLRDLVEHTGMVHRWMAAATRERTMDSPDRSTFEPPTEPIADWFGRGVDDAILVMSSLDGTEPRWTWHTGPDGQASWYFRRFAQETYVHRIDAELAAGVAVDDVDPHFAVDGVDEMCDVFLPHAAGQPINGGGATLHLHATDADGEWLLTLHDDRVDVARGHAKGDAAIRGAARDLLLQMWGRDPVGELEVFGDAAVVETFRAAAKL